MSTAKAVRLKIMGRDEWVSCLKRVLDLQQQTWGLCRAICHIPGRLITWADLACQAQDLIRMSILPLEEHVFRDVPDAGLDFVYRPAHPEYVIEPHLPSVIKRSNLPMPLDSWVIEGRRIQTIRDELHAMAAHVAGKLGNAKVQRHHMYLFRADRRLLRVQRQLTGLLARQYPGADATDIMSPTSYVPVVFGPNGSIREHSSLRPLTDPESN